VVLSLASREKRVGDRRESARQFNGHVYESSGENGDSDEDGDSSGYVGRYKQGVRLYRGHNGY
jgi:hypothetical protein